MSQKMNEEMAQLMNELNDNNELSITLVERRRRLHELATEINKWEDESKRNAAIDKQLTPLRTTSTYDLMNRSNSNYSSPKQHGFNSSITKASPNKNQVSPFNYNIIGSSGSFLNKENSYTPNAIAKRKLDERTNNYSHLPSKISNSNLSRKDLYSAPLPPSQRASNNSNTVTNSSESLVKNMKSLFENQEQENAKLMTPKLIIQKFEALTRDPATATAASTTTGPTIPVKKPTSIGDKKISTGSNHSSNDGHELKKPDVVANSNPSQYSLISQETIKPKLVIEKFESLVKNNNNINNNENRKSDRSNEGGIQIIHHIRFSNDTKGADYQAVNNYGGINSLTYVSSIASNRSSQNLNDYDDEDEAIYDENYDVTKQTEEGIYEELASTKYDDQEMSQEIYGDSDDFNDTEEEEGDDDDEGDESDENEYTEMPTIQETTQHNESTVNNDTKNETIQQNARKSVHASNQTSCSTDVTTNESTDFVTDEPLFSIKEYRKQKKSNSSGNRRSSAFKLTNSTINSSNGKNKTNAKQTRPECMDEATRKAKNQERIKELEDLIKQEDNVIYQTGIALERCLNQAQFTGSGEHIECNRLLLIACQKRQAYLTEINRIKNLNQKESTSDISKPLYPNLTSLNGSLDDSASVSNLDLTGTLIFSDIQLPIKESYLNKLKSGEEKRIFYFICLVRNGIQVLQTQVISVQELLSGRETAISFPNRMAINNVDVNFKVKIDVYTMEMVPKDSKAHKHQHSNATHKFFSPLKNTVMNTLSLHGANSSSNGSSSHSSSSNNSSNSKNSNHHYHETSSLGLANGCSKTSNFIHVDTIEITSKDLSNSKFRLSISSSSIPLIGILYAKVRCTPSKSIELRGFLTIFEDSNGYGSWDRRWCFLNNYSISYWKYPEDEYRSTPLGIISLSECSHDSVKVLPRDMCARKYTIELVLKAAASSSSSSNKKSDQVDQAECKRYRLSADNKEQASEWTMHVNWALANLKLWNPKN